MSLLGDLTRLGSDLFLPVRRLAGPLHRSRRALPDEILAHDAALPPLPPPWDSEPHWYRTDFPPHRHNRLTPLPHGDRYFGDLLETLAGARERVTIAGWCLTPLMSMRDDDGTLLAEVLRDVSRHAEVYVLLWSGAPALFEPDNHYTHQARRTLIDIAPRVRCVLDDRAAFSHDHHQKAVTIDGRVAYVGGMDLTTFQGNRWDTAVHPLRYGPNWHDVQMRMEGEVVRDVEENFLQRWEACTGRGMPPIEPQYDESWNAPAQIVRTVPRGFYPFAPDGIHSIAHAVLEAIRHAEHFVYLENQYLWSPEVVEALREAISRRRDTPFRVVIVLPARAYSGRYDNDRHVRNLRADCPPGSFEAYSVWTAGPAAGLTGFEYRAIYVHAKVTIVDDRWVIVGSANLNQRGLATDTEICVQAEAPEVARALRVSLWAEHLGMTEEEVAGRDPIDLIDHAWKERAAALADTLRHNQPPAPGQVVRYTADTRPVARLLDRLQSATLEH